MFKRLNEQLKPYLETLNKEFGGSNLDYKNPDKIYRSVLYFEEDNIEVNIWLFEQNQKYRFALYSEKHRFLWEKRFKEVFKEFNPKVYTFESNGNTHQLKIEFNVPLDTDLKQLDDKIYSMLEEALEYYQDRNYTKEDKWLKNKEKYWNKRQAVVNKQFEEIIDSLENWDAHIIWVGEDGFDLRLRNSSKDYRLTVWDNDKNNWRDYKYDLCTTTDENYRDQDILKTKSLQELINFLNKSNY